MTSTAGQGGGGQWGREVAAQLGKMGLSSGHRCLSCWVGTCVNNGASPSSTAMVLSLRGSHFLKLVVCSLGACVASVIDPSLYKLG